MTNRFSSRRRRLDHTFLADRLSGAKTYQNRRLLPQF
jgi:hypothetical protein